MNVELIDVMGSDLTVVNAARVSFNKHHTELEDNDEKLIAYLAKHGHWTPFGHPQIQFRISAPIYVARQLVKHQVGLVWNEVSRRYVDYEPTFEIPTQWRDRPKNRKQGSGVSLIQLSDDEVAEIRYIHAASSKMYNHLIDKGVAPEQARAILPQDMVTEWYWTGSLAAFARVCTLRLSEDSQDETRQVAQKIEEYINDKFPLSWKHLVGG
tara:strand:- start:1410 stop:2042 length:633 start_codon:yes stop_codon:yes gene_type:complete